MSCAGVEMVGNTPPAPFNGLQILYVERSAIEIIEVLKHSFFGHEPSR